MAASFDIAQRECHCRVYALDAVTIQIEASSGTVCPLARGVSASRIERVAAATRSYLEVNENFNAGWRAAIDGRTLLPVQLDGWKQAWVLPAGTSGVVTLNYQPAATYRESRTCLKARPSPSCAFTRFRG